MSWGRRATLAACLALSLALAALLARNGWRQPLLWAIGLGLGATLHWGSFGFASGYRRWFVERDGGGVLAQLLLVALTTLLFAPFLAAGEAFGRPVTGAVAPVGISVVVGAFLFGIGMPLAGGCGSGTLYALGSGKWRMAAVLAAACAGSFGATLHMPWWQGLPSSDPIALADRMGWPGAVALQLVVMALVAVWIARRSRASGCMTEPFESLQQGQALMPRRVAIAAGLLALGGLATLVVAGHPWSIMWGYTLWGAKAAMALGWEPATSAFWNSGAQRDALAGGLLDDTTSLMDLAIIVGAAISAAMQVRPPALPSKGWSTLGWAILGGLALGYGGRIAYGCNIGAFVSGAASGSLHGWLWILAALPGVVAGLRLRRAVGS